MLNESNDQTTLFDLVVRWEELRMEGRETSPEVVCHCAGFPELAPELARQVQKLRALEPPQGPLTEQQIGPAARCTNGNEPTSPARSRFQRLRLHARGGLGEVHVALDEELRREVAIKELKAERAKSPANQARFLREAEITGSLEHPGIVPVYGLGWHGDGRPFYAMRLIRGESLGAALKRFHAAELGETGSREMELRKLLRRFLDVCNAVAYAHSRGVIHRDLKPENIMLGPFGETLVVDWGVAKVLGWPHRPLEEQPPGDSGLADQHGLQTLPGSVLGTPSFMSPEQAEGLDQRIGPATDIYSLGATLYNILTGKVPFEATERTSVLERIKRGQIVRPRDLDRGVPRALEAVCLKAMALEPDDRYSSAHGLAEDIERWLADEPVTAWREPWIYRARRWITRHRTGVAAAAAACAAALSLGAIGLYSHQAQLRRETDQAERALRSAEEALRVARAASTERPDSSAWDRAEELASDALYLDNRRLPSGLRRRLRRLSESTKAEARQARADAGLLEDLATARVNRMFDWANSSEEYRSAFERRHLHVDVDDPASSIAALSGRPTRIAAQIASYLDDWWASLRSSEGAADCALRLAAVARALDADPWRNALRDALSIPEEAKRRQAVLELGAASDAASQPSPTTTMLSRALRLTGQAAAAVSLMEAARFRYPGDPWIHQELGWALLWSSPPRREDALRAFTAATTLRPELGYTLAKKLHENGKADEAVAVLENLLRYKAYAWYLMELGKMKADSGRFSEARELYQRAERESRRVLENSPDDFVATGHLAEALRRMGDKAGALEPSRKALRLRPGAAMAHNNHGYLLFASGDTSGAIDELNAALRLDPGLGLAHLNLGAVLTYSGQRDAGRVELEKAERFGYDPAVVRVQAAFTLREVGDVSSAIPELRKAIALNPNYTLAHYELGIALSDVGEPVAGIEELRQASRLGYDSAWIHYQIGCALRNAHNHAAAITELEEAIRLDPDFAIAHNHIGLVLRESGNMSGALAEHRKALELDPNLSDAHNYLAIALQKSGDIRGAIEELKVAIQLSPKISSAHNNLGYMLSEAGDLPGAIKEYAEATRLDPYDPRYHINLATALKDSGRLQEALAAIERGHAVAAGRPDSQRATAELRDVIQREIRLRAPAGGELPPKVFTP
jgi:tetratricopeptide (TPR) repeat protein